MFDGKLLSGVKQSDFSSDDAAEPPIAGDSSGGREPERCSFCQRTTVKRASGFCRNWDQIFPNCPHAEEAEELLSK